MENKKKCKYCKEKRNARYEFAQEDSKTCVFCNQKGVDDSNYKRRLLGGITEPKSLSPVRKCPKKIGMRFKQ